MIIWEIRKRERDNRTYKKQSEQTYKEEEKEAKETRGKDKAEEEK